MQTTPYQRLTEKVTLPVSQKVVTITEGDGYSERMLLKKGKKMFEVMFDYLASLVLDIDGKKASPNDLLDLLLPDQEFLAIACYKLNYGNMFEFSHLCSSCGHEEDRAVDLNALEFQPWPKEFGAPSPDPTVGLELPKSKKKLVLGLLNGHKERKLMEQASSGAIDLNQAVFQSIRTVDGGTDFAYEDVVSLPLADIKAIRKKRRKMTLGYDTTASVVCSECGANYQFNILSHSDFLLPGG